MILCAFDIETGALGQDANILEIGCALFCTDTHHIFERYSSLVWGHDYAPPFEEALKVNHLTTDVLKRHGKHPTFAFPKVIEFFKAADAIIAHNGTNFDRPIFLNQARRYNTTVPEKIWMDSRLDLPFPDNMTSRRLQHLAIDHGLSWDHEMAHTALYDVMKMLEIAKNYDLEEAFKRAQSPMITVETQIPREKNTLAKARRYYWDSANRAWRKNIREIDFDKEKDEAPFTVTKVQHGKT